MLLLEDKSQLKSTQSEHSNSDFVPTPEMIKFAEAYIESKRNITSACFAIDNPSRSIWYDYPKGWRFNAPFQKWLQQYCKAQVLKHIGDWYLIAEKHAEKGSYSHLEMLMQLAKEFTKESGGKVVVQNIITNKVDANGNGGRKFDGDDAELARSYRERLRTKHL
jgi:hypothetical protein